VVRAPRVARSKGGGFAAMNVCTAQRIGKSSSRHSLMLTQLVKEVQRMRPTVAFGRDVFVQHPQWDTGDTGYGAFDRRSIREPADAQDDATRRSERDSVPEAAFLSARSARSPRVCRPVCPEGPVSA
jgi:hypothetical protein